MLMYVSEIYFYLFFVFVCVCVNSQESFSKTERETKRRRASNTKFECTVYHPRQFEALRKHFKVRFRSFC